MQHYRLCSSVSNLLSQDGGLETQLLFGERCLLDDGGKYYAYSQIIYSRKHNVWHPYPGYISEQFDAIPGYLAPNALVKTFDAFLEPWHIPLPYGSALVIDPFGNVCLPRNFPSVSKDGKAFCDLNHLRFLNESFSLTTLLQESQKFLDFPYLWGGRCAHNCLVYSGVDCSGFIQILFQANGWNIPRNSRDQYQDCTFIDSFNSLPLGGFVFLQEDKDKHISHIMLKTSSTSLIHALQPAGKVVYFEIGKDGEFAEDRFYFPKKEGKAFFGIPKKRKIFF